MPDVAILLRNREVLSRLVVILVGFSFCYYSVFIELVRQWDNNNTYSFGYIVPLISLYLVWKRRDQLSRLEITPAPVPGILILGFSTALYFAGKIGGTIILQEFSIIVALPAIMLIVMGKRVTRLLAFPLSYLVLMLPAWDYPIEWVQFPFQLLSAHIAGWMLPLFGVPAYQNGILIAIPNLTIEVAKECSGVNFLISIIAIGIPVAALYFDSWWKRFLLLLVSILIAILGNGLRAALICLFAYKGYSTNLHGPGHIFYGYFVSFLGLAVMFMGVYLFGKPTAGSVAGEDVPETPARDASGPYKKNWKWPIVAMLLFLTAGFATRFQTLHPAPLVNDLRDFPRSIGNYTGVEQPPVLEGLAGNGADAELSRTYTDGRNGNYQLYVGYYAFQEQKKKVTNYRARALLRDAKAYPFPTPLSTDGEINGLVSESKGVRRLVLFWYDVDGKIVSNQYSVILKTAVSDLLRNRTNAAIVAIATEYDPDSDLPSQIRRHSGFAKEVAILLEKYLDAS
jgi:EpsI family protein